MTKKRLVLIAVGLFVVYLTVVVARFPAATAVGWFAPDTVKLVGVTGTVWHGEAAAINAPPLRFGASTWDYTSSSLFGPAIAYDVELNRPDGFVRGTVELALSGRLVATDVNFDLQLASMPELMNLLQVPPDTTGRVIGGVGELVVQDGWPSAVSGTLNLENLVVTYLQTVDLGDYQMVFPGGDMVMATIEDIDAPIDLQGTTLVLSPERCYELDGLIATTARTPDAIRNALRFLDDRDEAGRTVFRRDGCL